MKAGGSSPGPPPRPIRHFLPCSYEPTRLFQGAAADAKGECSLVCARWAWPRGGRGFPLPEQQPRLSSDPPEGRSVFTHVCRRSEAVFVPLSSPRRRQLPRRETDEECGRSPGPPRPSCYHGGGGKHEQPAEGDRSATGPLVGGAWAGRDSPNGRRRGGGESNHGGGANRGALARRERSQ